jgi:protoheme ferro-lyase
VLLTDGLTILGTSMPWPVSFSFSSLAILAEDIKANFNEEELKKLLIVFSAHSIPLEVMTKGDWYPYEIQTSASLVNE